MSKTSANLIFLLSIATTIIGQLLLKKAAAAQRLTFDPSQLWATVLGLALNPYLLGWVLSAGVSATLWILVVSRFELSMAFPIATTLSYILILVLSWWLFDEQMTVARWIGVGLMSAGIFITYQS